MLEIKQNEENGIINISMKGTLDAGTVSKLNDVIDGLSDVGNGVTVDCTGLERISGTGFEALSRLSKITKAFGKEFRITNVSENVYYLFNVTGFTDILKIEKAEDCA